MFTTHHTHRPAIRELRAVGRRDFLRACAAASVAFPFSRTCRAVPALDGSGNRIVVGLEVGTSKVCAAVAERRSDMTIEILGIGRAPAPSLEGGVLNFETVGKSVLEALRDAETKSGATIRSVVLGIGGFFGGGPNGCDRVPGDPEEICYFDERNGALRGIGSVALREGKKSWHILSSHGSGVRRRIRGVEDLGIKVESVVALPAASAEAVLDSEQRKRGVLVMDIGAKRTTVATYINGILDRSACLPFHCTVGECAGEQSNSACEFIDLILFYFSPGPIWTLDRFHSAVLTGGCSTIHGMLEGAKEYFGTFGLTVQLSRTQGVSGDADVIDDPRNAAAIGLVKCALMED